MDINSFSNVRNPEYRKDGKILLTVDIEGIGKDIPFVADKDDIVPHGKTLFNMAKSGKFGTIKQYTE